jgi:putative flippase GtrA
LKDSEIISGVFSPADSGTGSSGVVAGLPVVLIPAYKPEPVLPCIVRDLLESGQVAGVVVVNDGSGPDYDWIFSEIAEITNVHLLRHVVNLGKGTALKTGLNYAACQFPHSIGVVTADADGQHRVEDILRTADGLVERPTHLVLGVRKFDGDVPWRSKFGNSVTRHILSAVTGQKLTDTQTGLRGIPMDFIPLLMKSKAGGYDFELDMLLTCRNIVRPITEVTIATVYLDGNRSSNFNPVLDSMRIYFLFLRFSAVSLITAGLDNLAFFLTFYVWPDVVASMVVARAISGIFNYLANKRGVFRSHAQTSSALPKYLLSMLVAGCLSYLLLINLASFFHMPIVAAKLTAETIMFFFSFVLQRDFIFNASESKAD